MKQVVSLVLFFQKLFHPTASSDMLSALVTAKKRVKLKVPIPMGHQRTVLHRTDMFTLYSSNRNLSVVVNCFLPPIPHPSHRKRKLVAFASFQRNKNYPTVVHSSSAFSVTDSGEFPNWERITNHQTSKTVKIFKSIHRANKSRRSELGQTVAEGVRLVTDILSNDKSRHLVRRVVVSESLLFGKGSWENQKYQQQLKHWLFVSDKLSREQLSDVKGGEASFFNQNQENSSACCINIGTDEVLAACSGTVTAQGVVALMDIPEPYNPLDDISPDIPPFYLILDGLSDPGNVGTLLRTCAASYVTAVILLPNSCDVWNPKAVRSAMGASFRVPVYEIDDIDKKGYRQDDIERTPLDKLIKLMEQCGVQSDRIFAATMEDSWGVQSISYYDIDWVNSCQHIPNGADNLSIKRGGAALILGKEAEGLGQDVRHAIEQSKISTVHIPMAVGSESLNAAICGSVIMFERMRQLLSQKNE